MIKRFKQYLTDKKPPLDNVNSIDRAKSQQRLTFLRSNKPASKEDVFLNHIYKPTANK